MHGTLLHLPYFGPVTHFAEVVNAEQLWFENDDNYQKQTYRNRMYIYGANGKLLLNIPIKHLNSPGVKQHQKYRDVRMEKDFDWQKQHWKSLKSAYQTSPFFEFYEDDLAPLYHTDFEFLTDFNYRCFEKLCECLQLDIPFEKTSEYIKEPLEKNDRRDLINAKVDSRTPAYNQVFQEKKGFLSNLSILDLVFNEGPNTINYLRELSFRP
ncbi:WbqC family protein [Antarcticibacterium sp. 1MA-6-2]|uniref:WbqC family protein n=1 Tax=Antarcticibacterium sp. 1MA-6-2 TaxID=2908210 RepID=UPI001F243C62|nr:WbqC family protein [Antarcticibacterium sp. 1MA-6-2]UJH92112.1 WbqC family protein [Antarcticibacterium sp. 1MA-6-2]